MNKYHIQHRIHTLAECAVMEEGRSPASFECEGVTFSHGEFNFGDGWLSDTWFAEEVTEAENMVDAINIFTKKLWRISSRISLLSQSYIEMENEPFLIHNIEKDIAYYKHSKERGAVGLMFQDREKKGLEILLKNKEMPDHFFYYWNDAINTLGYSSKLLVMFSAVESLSNKNGKKDWSLVESILGADLKDQIFAPVTGLRHRLVHGEYFNPTDSKTNYLELIHKKVITYFNDLVFKDKLIAENVTSPQRHIFGNKEIGKAFIKVKDPSIFNFDIKLIKQDFDNNRPEETQHYQRVYNIDVLTY